MAETWHAEELSAREALDTIEEARAYERPLRRRTEGVTWMVWGLVTAGIQLTFTAGRGLFRPFRPARGGGPPPGWFEPLVVLGWLALGMLLTVAVWRIASVRAPQLSPKPVRTALGGLLFVGLLYTGIGLLAWLAGGLPVAFYPLLAIGGAWLAVGILNVFETTSLGRRTLLAIGALTLAVGVLAVVALPWTGYMAYNEELTYDAVAPIVVLAGGGIPFLAGLWQSWTG